MGSFERRAIRPLILAVSAGLVVALSGCGGGGDSKRSPVSSESPTVAAKRTISGRISYPGTALDGHKIVIAVSRQGDQGAPAYSATLTKAGTYTIGDVADGTYTILAFIDLGNDMGAPQANEPLGTYDPDSDGTANPFVVANGAPVNGIDISIRDR